LERLLLINDSVGLKKSGMMTSSIVLFFTDVTIVQLFTPFLMKTINDLLVVVSSLRVILFLVSIKLGTVTTPVLFHHMIDHNRLCIRFVFYSLDFKLLG